jgi:hypothetical protein
MQMAEQQKNDVFYEVRTEILEARQDSGIGWLIGEQSDESWFQLL